MRFLSLIALTVAAAAANAQRCPTGSWGTALAVQFAPPRFAPAPTAGLVPLPGLYDERTGRRTDLDPVIRADGRVQTVVNYSGADPVPAGKFDVPDPRDGGVYHCTTAEQAAAVRAMLGGKTAAPIPPAASAPKAAPTPAPKTADADRGDLDEVNAQRARRGLPPYRLDPDLTRAAQAAADYRARNRIEGHCNDFSFLPAGIRAACAGCAAWPLGTGFGACDLYANWTFCGAASAVGPDGRRYMHCFYR